jgi:hypothetical protein
MRKTSASDHHTMRNSDCGLRNLRRLKAQSSRLKVKSKAVTPHNAEFGQ